MHREIQLSFTGILQGPAKVRIILVYLGLICLNVLAWELAFTTFAHHHKLIALCVMAYMFGLRHAVDADHIAAIDNVTRKLMAEGRKPVCVGLFFSLGHSTIVVIMSFCVALGADYLRSCPGLKETGSLIGTLVSAFFLLLIAVLNLIIFIDLFRTFLSLKRGKGYSEETLEEFLNKRGLVSRILRPLFKLVSRSWHMYFIGLLFGLGFDTASEIALLGISADSVAMGIPIWSIMIFPLLFMSGMCLVDTTDGVLMLGAYGWAFVNPARKLFYNMTITFVSFLIAFLIGGIEALGLLGGKLGLQGGFWRGVEKLNDNFSYLGYLIVGLLASFWLVSTIFYKLTGMDKLGLQNPAENG